MWFVHATTLRLNFNDNALVQSVVLPCLCSKLSPEGALMCFAVLRDATPGIRYDLFQNSLCKLDLHKTTGKVDDIS